MNVPTVIYKYFEECQDFTMDQYWKDVFFSCACGKFPKNCRYDPSNNTLYIRLQTSSTKTKGEAISLPQNPEELFLVMMDVFKNKLGMFSSRDLQIKKDELEDIQKQYQINMNCDWKKLKPRSVKEFLIINYITSLQQQYFLTSKETKNLLTYVNIWIQLKKITSDDIKYENKSIVAIRGMDVDKETKVWKNTNPCRFITKVEKVNKPQKFEQSLNKFISGYKFRKSKLNIV